MSCSGAASPCKRNNEEDLQYGRGRTKGIRKGKDVTQRKKQRPQVAHPLEVADMSFKQMLEQEGSDEKDVVHLLESVNVETATKEDLANLVIHLKKQFKIRYMYLVGEWRNARRAKNTRNGQFASVKEVADYLNNKTL